MVIFIFMKNLKIFNGFDILNILITHNNEIKDDATFDIYGRIYNCKIWVDDGIVLKNHTNLEIDEIKLFLNEI